MGPLALLALAGTVVVVGVAASSDSKPSSSSSCGGLSLGKVSPAGLTDDQKLRVETYGADVKAKWAALKADTSKWAERAGNFLGGQGWLAKAIVDLGFWLSKNEDWFTPEQKERANQAVISMLQYGLNPADFSSDLHAGYEGWADRLEDSIRAMQALPDATQKRWMAFAACMYRQPETNWFPLGGAKGKDFYSFVRDDAALASFGRAYAAFVGAGGLSTRYANQAVRIGRWLRTEEPFRYTTAADYMRGLTVLLDNIDQPSFGGESNTTKPVIPMVVTAGRSATKRGSQLAHTRAA